MTMELHFYHRPTDTVPDPEVGLLWVDFTPGDVGEPEQYLLQVTAKGPELWNWAGRSYGFYCELTCEQANLLMFQVTSRLSKKGEDGELITDQLIQPVWHSARKGE
jgi:hypothetical protein